MRVDFSVGGERRSQTVGEGGTLTLPAGAKVIVAVYGDFEDDLVLVERTMDIAGKLNALVADGTLDVDITNDLAGRDPAPMVVKRIVVDYTLNGVKKSVTVRENQRLSLPAGLAGLAEPPVYELEHERGGLVLRAWVRGDFAFESASGATRRLSVSDVPAPVEVEGPWNVTFPPGLGGPESVDLAKLVSWTEHEDAGVKYFSGTATYSKDVDVPAEALRDGRRVYVDLGRVSVIARVKVNGTDLGCLWKPPFRADATAALRAGPNRLEVAVTNLWVNRLIGDEQEPDDCEWAGTRLAGWPDWLVEGRPRPSKGRVAFTTWKHWRAHDELLPSGLLGPVRLEHVVVKELP